MHTPMLILMEWTQIYYRIIDVYNKSANLDSLRGASTNFNDTDRRVGFSMNDCKILIFKLLFVFWEFVWETCRYRK